MNCIIVDDEPLAREGMVDLVKTQDNLLLKGSFNNAIKAEEFLMNNNVDLIFLDIEMPGVNGLEFAKSIPEKTLIVFTTAYKEYAFDSYTVDAVDYLLKPILQEHFQRAVNKAFAFHKLLLNVESKIENVTKDFLLIKSERRYYKILFDKILFIEGLKDYVVLFTKNDKVITAMNLKTIHTKLSKEKFIRVSKSYIVNGAAIESFDNHTIYIRDYEIPIGNVYQENFYKQYLEKEL